MVVADTHLGLLSGKRFYLIRNNSTSDTLGFAGFVRWLRGLESNTIELTRGKWGKPVQVHKPRSLILLGDYLELWDSTDEAVDISSRGIWNDMEDLSCEKIYVVGNHDFEITEVADFLYPQGESSIEVLRNTCPAQSGQPTWLKVGNTSYLLLHGHQFDWTFQHLGKAWTFVSYLRDGAEAFRLWSWFLTGAVIATAVATLFFPSSATILWSIACTLLVAVAFPRLVITFARPIWNRFLATRYKSRKALRDFASWWKKFAKDGNIPNGPFSVVYGHTHLIDIYDSNDFKAADVDLPSSLTLVNIPSWVLDIRAEYSKILRDVALYIDDDGFHFLGWDWEKQDTFYIPSDVVRMIAAGIPIGRQTVEDLKNIGWPEKLLSKLQQPSRILSLNHPAPKLRVELSAKLSGQIPS
jgi:UDP-2,3-diacylglucosamine pyrophosphatase LpxH